MGGLFRGNGDDDEENDDPLADFDDEHVQSQPLSENASVFVDIGASEATSAKHALESSAVGGGFRHTEPRAGSRGVNDFVEGGLGLQSPAPLSAESSHQTSGGVVRPSDSEKPAGSFVVSTVRQHSFARLPLSPPRPDSRCEGMGHKRSLSADGAAGAPSSTLHQRSPSQRSPRLALSSTMRSDTARGDMDRARHTTQLPLPPFDYPDSHTVVGDSSSDDDDAVAQAGKPSAQGSGSLNGSATRAAFVGSAVKGSSGLRAQSSASAGSTPVQRPQLHGSVHAVVDNQSGRPPLEDDASGRAGNVATDAGARNAAAPACGALHFPPSLSPPFRQGASSPPSSPPDDRTAQPCGDEAPHPPSSSRFSELSPKELRVGPVVLPSTGTSADPAIDAVAPVASDAAKAVSAAQPPRGTGTGVLGAARQLLSTYAAAAGGLPAGSQAMPGFADEIRRVQSERARAAALSSGANASAPSSLLRAASSRHLGGGGEAAAVALNGNSPKLRLGGRGIELSPGVGATMSMGSTSTAAATAAAAAAVLENEERVLQDVAAGRASSAAPGAPRPFPASVASPSRSVFSGQTASAALQPSRRLSLEPSTTGQQSPGSELHRRRSSQQTRPADGRTNASAGVGPERVEGGAPSGPRHFGERAGIRVASLGAAANVRAASQQRARQLVLRQTLDSLFALATEMQVRERENGGGAGGILCQWTA